MKDSGKLGEISGMINIINSIITEIGEVFIKGSTLLPYGCEGYSRDGTNFRIVFLENKFLLLRMTPTSENLAFAVAINRVIGYKAFCHYENGNQEITFEWAEDGKEREERFDNLKNGEKKGKIKELKKLFWNHS
jgi:hypothetical protein